MIVSHARRFIFVKTSKTAGSSIELLLSKFCGPDDIVTPGLEAKNEQFAEFSESRRPRNLEIPWHRAVLLSLPPYVRAKKHLQFRRTYYDHMPAFRIKRTLPASIWDTYYKFSIVRNPYDRAVSQYFWIHRGDRAYTKEAINDFVLTAHPHLFSNWYMYASRGRVLLDYFIRYENLGPGLDTALAAIGVHDAAALPRAKSEHRPQNVPYRDMIGPAARNRIEKIARPELQYFAYEW